MKPIERVTLDPAKADYGALYGARVGAYTLLELGSGTTVIVGHMSCGSWDDATRHVRRMQSDGRRADADSDRRVSKATFDSWMALTPDSLSGIS